MTNLSTNIERTIEHTLLKPDITTDMLIKLFEEAKENNFLGVCINPKYIPLAKIQLKDSNVKIVTVIGFPLGANSTSVKAFEAKKAIEDGADEVDMVIDICAIKDKGYTRAQKDIEKVLEACNGTPLKVILETDLLTTDEIEKACEICIEAKAQFVKTSTGFVKGGVGAKEEDVKLMHKIVSPHGIQVKASGGVRDKETAIKMIEAGATRIGTSSGVSIVSGNQSSQTGY